MIQHYISITNEWEHIQFLLKMKDQMQNSIWLEYIITSEIWSSNVFWKYRGNFLELAYILCFLTDLSCMSKQHLSTVEYFQTC